MKRIRFAILVIIALAGGYYAGTLFQKKAPPPVLASVLDPPKEIRPFELVGGDGEKFTLDDFKGHWTLVYFGYTYCPDICPTTLMDISRAYNRLADKPDILNNLKTLLISVDPDRDTPTRLQEYVTFFRDDYIAATGDKEALAQVAKDFSAYYKVHEPDENGNYPVDHSSIVSLVNPEGKIQAIFISVAEAPQVASDLAGIMDS
ncbi:MAG: SCO family protein [Gammaproteobacteria bacterium]